MNDSSPLRVRLRQGIPTRVMVDGVRCRFGINSWEADEQLIHFTILRDGKLTGFDVREGDRVDVLDRNWTVSELSVPESGPAKLTLDELAAPT
ncbi:MAG: hypothetical protein L0K86_20575 [Actinomycetia bacterium]|nr:hypothetical protein [Actinomycetes bacterium]